VSFKTVLVTYILHFNSDLGGRWYRESNNYGDQRHYIGKSNSPTFRIQKQHKLGRGSKTTKVACRRGIGMKLGWFVKGDCESEIAKSDFRALCRYCK